MIDLAKKFADKNVVWLAINSTSHATQEKNKAFDRKHDLQYPILDDSSGDVGRKYDAKRTPHMFVIDKKGYIQYEGAIDNSPLGKNKDDVVNYVEKALDQLIKGNDVTTPRTKPYGCTVKYQQN